MLVNILVLLFAQSNSFTKNYALARRVGHVTVRGYYE
jgi:hypothetical protein